MLDRLRRVLQNSAALDSPLGLPNACPAAGDWRWNAVWFSVALVVVAGRRPVAVRARRPIRPSSGVDRRQPPATHGHLRRSRRPSRPRISRRRGQRRHRAGQLAAHAAGDRADHRERQTLPIAWTRQLHIPRRRRSAVPPPTRRSSNAWAPTARPTDKAVEEEFCWLMSLVDQDWRIAGISYSAGPQQTLMIYSFENPEKGAMPVQQLMAQLGRPNCRCGHRRSNQPQSQTQSTATRPRRREPRKKRFRPARIASRPSRATPCQRHAASNSAAARQVANSSPIAASRSCAATFFRLFARCLLWPAPLDCQFCRRNTPLGGTAAAYLRQDAGNFVI